MSDDLLSRATRALREDTRDDDASADFTRSRIMASVHEQRVRRRTRFAFLLPIAATFAAASAWGANNGKLAHVVTAVTDALGITEPAATAPAPATPPAPPRLPSAAPAALPAPPLEPAAPLSPEPTAPADAPEPKPAPKGTSERPSEAKTSGVAGAANDPAFELYRAAHQAHFVERDPARALRGWDAYLKAAPNAPLALEARYNRAICLVRLHWNEEALAALRPFAEGRYGGYRKAEAQKLIDALPGSVPGPASSGL